MIGDPVTPVTCDKCGYVENFDMTSLASRSWDNRYLEGKLKRAGWATCGEDTVCPDCIAEEIEE